MSQTKTSFAASIRAQQQIRLKSRDKSRGGMSRDRRFIDKAQDANSSIVMTHAQKVSTERGIDSALNMSLGSEPPDEATFDDSRADMQYPIGSQGNSMIGRGIKGLLAGSQQNQSFRQVKQSSHTISHA